jgi:hypothetical protein
MIRSGPFVSNEGCGLEGSSPSETASPSQDALQGTVPLVVSCIVFVGLYLDLISGENKTTLRGFRPRSHRPRQDRILCHARDPAYTIVLDDVDWAHPHKHRLPMILPEAFYWPGRPRWSHLKCCPSRGKCSRNRIYGSLNTITSSSMLLPN